MKKYMLIGLGLLTIHFGSLNSLDKLFSQEIPIQVPSIPEEPSGEVLDSQKNTDQNDISKKINLDMQVLYGVQYNQMFSALNLSQESDSFVYLVSSNFSRSSDFGYNDETFVNSGFYENKIGLTANWNWDNTKLIIDGEADNDSRGMFNNDVYSREEKGKDKISAKTIYKYSPSTEVYLALGSAWYKHSLVALDPGQHVNSRLLQGNLKVGGEFVWSSANSLRINAGLLYYDYRPEEPEELKNDNHMKVEIFDDFSITRNIGFSIGGGYVRNEDDDTVEFPWPLSASLFLKGYKNFSSTISYKYDIVPFQPEEFYLEQKYIYPNYNLPPGIVHNGEAKADLKVNSILNIKGNLQVEKNYNFYNYCPVEVPVEGNVLTADTLKVISYSSGLEANITVFENYEKTLEFGLGYKYFYFDAEENITYQPDYTALGSVRYNGKKWKFEWSNEIKGKVYTEPDNDERIPEAVIGSLGIQRIILEGSYFYGKIENLYNNKYTLRKDYPEPGTSVLGGLRILI